MGCLRACRSLGRREFYRISIYNAFRRKESFATSGPRMTIRFFAGYDLDASKINDPDLVEHLVCQWKDPWAQILMGSPKHSELSLSGPVRDSFTAPLQRVQIIKGYVDSNGNPQEQVFDVACSDGAAPDPVTHQMS